MYKTPLATIVSVLIALTAATAALAAPAPADPGKQTTLGLYLTAKEAYAMTVAPGATVKLLDVRSPEEYVLNGHAPAAANIPFSFMSGFLSASTTAVTNPDGSTSDATSYSLGMDPNPLFLSQVQAKFAPGDTIIVMCAGGGRGAKAVNAMAAAGYTMAYNVVDGFEGDVVDDPDSYYVGKKLKNGWKNSGAPWTHAIDPALVTLTVRPAQ